MDYEGLGMRVRRARKLAGLTQSELAEKLGISTSFLGHIERGSRKASMDTIVKISNELTVSLDSLLADSLTARSAKEGETQYTPRQRVALREAVRALAENLDAFILDDD
ncbi:MAG: helix-turn-helix domain-containing protein [Candidatus Fimadaptatus sp.]